MNPASSLFPSAGSAHATEEDRGDGRCRAGYLPAAFVALLVLTSCLAALYAGFLLRDSTTSHPPTEDSAAAGFARDMTVHHTQAVAMAQVARHSSNWSIRTLATDIQLTQQAQIGQLQGWLEQWGLPLTGTQPAMAWMGEPPGTRMPGMATPAKMARLKHAHGKASDILFLQLMIRHHRGALGMAQAALDLSDRPEVRSFAQKTIVAQASEIAAMDSMLADLGGKEMPSQTMAQMTAREGMAGGQMEAMGHGEEEGGFAAGLDDFLRSFVHYLAIVIGGFAAVALLIDLARRQRWLPRTTKRVRLSRDPVWVLLLFGGLMGSAAAHAALAPEHFAENNLYGWFFVVSTVFAVVLAAALAVVGHPKVLTWSAALLTALVAVYLLFRVIAPPFASGPESFDAIGLLTQVVQVVGVAAALVLGSSEPEQGLHCRSDH